MQVLKKLYVKQPRCYTLVWDIGEAMAHATRGGAVLGILILLAGDLLAQTQTFCSNIAGNIACTSYDNRSSSQSYCTSIGGGLTCTTFNNDYNHMQVLQNYEAGQVIGTALGNGIRAAIAQYQANKRIRQAKQDEWNQFVQDTLSSTELECEASPARYGTTVVGCRIMIATFNQFLRAHQKDFVPDGRNVKILAEALEKTAPADQSTWTEQTLEKAYQAVDKKNLDKKILLGLGQNKTTW